MVSDVDTQPVSAPGGAPGLQARWSRYVTVPGAAGDPPVRWHLLDNRDDLLGPARGTLLAVHGNPTHSYLWRSLLPAASAAGWRVVAVDQLGMGRSSRDGRQRRLADRIEELGALTDHLGLGGPVVTIGHDWGGPISLGWALQHPKELAGVVLANTAVDNGDHPLPALLRLASLPALQQRATRDTQAFLRSTLALARPNLPPDVKAAYLAPYAGRENRQAIADFVNDIPATPEHASYATLAEVAAGTAQLTVPALVLWGVRDPVFQARHLRDLLQRLPHADVQRFSAAGHLVIEDADVAGTITHWLSQRLAPADRHGTVHPAQRDFEPVTRRLDHAVERLGPALIALHDGERDVVSWAQLARRARQLAHGLQQAGVGRGDRVSLLVPPGWELTTALFACLRIGAVVVVADEGLGPAGLTQAIRSADPDAIIGIERGLSAARLLGWPGRRIAAGPLARSKKRLLGVEHTMPELIAHGRGRATAGARLGPEPGAADDAAILFTSGSTGPAKGVVHTHGGLAAMCQVIAETYHLGPESSFVAGFAPFALLGTALGAVAVVPDMQVTSPGTLTATALAEAVQAGGARTVFTAPAALRNVLATASDLDDMEREALAGVELFLSAGAPIAPALLHRVAEVMPRASVHTPYGMTEALPVTDVDGAEIDRAGIDAQHGMPGAGQGVCVGYPVTGAEVRILPLDDDGTATGAPTRAPGVSGEVLLTAGHLKKTYDRLWATQAACSDYSGWHRSGDVGHLDEAGRLWISGRLADVVTTPRGPLTPVAIEQRVESLRGVRQAAAVGVGPRGTQRLVVIVSTEPSIDPKAAAAPGLATPGLTQAVRRVATEPVAAVLRIPKLPTDVRHNTKIDRARLAAWARKVLAGGRVGRP